jgi:hypothetical protein
MDTGQTPTTLEWALEPMDDRPLVRVALERAAPADLYFEIVGVADDLELVITI